MQQLQRELRAVLKTSPWVLAALLLVAVFWQADLGATAGLFQSPPEVPPTEPPPTIPPPTQAPTLTPVPLPTLEPGTLITGEPTVEVSSTVVFEEPTPTLELTATETPTLEPTATETPTATLTAEPTAEEGQTRGRYAEGESGLRFDWGMLFDSVALGVSYIWLCCGVFILVGIPIGFAVVWSASRRRRNLPE